MDFCGAERAVDLGESEDWLDGVVDGDGDWLDDVEAVVRLIGDGVLEAGGVRGGGRLSEDGDRAVRDGRLGLVVFAGGCRGSRFLHGELLMDELQGKLTWFWPLRQWCAGKLTVDGRWCGGEGAFSAGFLLV
jgi:hypothetical protein